MRGRGRSCLSLVLLSLLLSCSRAFEPGLYRIQSDGWDGFLQVGYDSLGAQDVRVYRNSGLLLADTVRAELRSERRKPVLAFTDGRLEKVRLAPYQIPDFQVFPEKSLYVVPQFEVRERRDIVYGRVLHNQPDQPETAEGEDLTMDLYEPLRDGSVSRPLLMMFHGGAFLHGDKRDSTVVEWCRYFASLGYVVSSVNYRQGYRRIIRDTDEILYRSLKDANAAVRFLLKRDSLMIHSERIFASGMDAGAITALNLAFLREENLPEFLGEDPSGEADSVLTVRQKLVRGYDIRAVSNLWGAVPDTAILQNAGIPVISFQSREDSVVPFGEGFPFEEPGDQEKTGPLRTVFRSILSIFLPDIHVFRKMYGAGIIHRVLKAAGTASELHAFDGSRHDLLYQEDGTVDYLRFEEISDKTARFFSSRMDTSPVSLQQDPEDLQVFYIDDSEVETCLWQVEGGAFVSRSSHSARILLFPDAPVHSVSVSGTYTSGLSFLETVTL